MRRFLLFSIMCLLGISVAYAQNETQARKILDKTAKVLGKKGGASANFTISNAKIGTVSGSIAIKGNKFNAKTQQAIVWFNGKTQWTYMKKNDEVNITTPTAAQQQVMNPYAFINIYRSGYKIGMKSKGNNYEVHLTAQSKNKSIQEMYITINKTTDTPSVVKMKQGLTWSTITISNFKAKNQPDNIFTFRQKDFPTAEVVDLR